MSLKLGSTSIGSLYLGSTKVGEAYLGSTKVYASAAPVDPYNPLGLPAYTMRVKVRDGYTLNTTYCTQVSESPNIWDIHKESTSWENILAPGRSGTVHIGNDYYALKEILGANTTGVTDFTSAFSGNMALSKVNLFDTRDATKCMSMFENDYVLTDVATFNTSSVLNFAYMFNQCKALVNAPLLDTSSGTNLQGICANCPALTSVPLYNTSSATDVRWMFNNDKNVQTGALALYTQMSTQANVPSNHANAFNNCGSDTVTGAAELAQIPSSWGGTGS